MIKLTETRSGPIYIAADQVAKIITPSPATQWHGTRAIIKMKDGSMHEVEETADKVAAAVEEEMMG